ncbi:MAG TPA: RsmD family RNA methyltransferase [Planctomycetota bacterium]|nr:RsmD family RNA methyltransferase [Planctomycetota bacterium]
MSLKVIAGIYGSRVLKSVRGLGTRPLLGQVKESVFNILGERTAGAFVWDLFAGTGASGIEALSRGAARVAFVEKNGRAVDVLRDNLRMLGEEAVANSLVLRADAWDPPVLHRSAFGAARADAPELPSDAEVAPDLVFLDPPYSMVEEDPVKSVYRARRLAQRLAPGGCLVFHFPEGMLAEDDFDPDFEVDLREYGSSAIAFLWRQGEAPSRGRQRREDARAGGET